MPFALTDSTSIATKRGTFAMRIPGLRPPATYAEQTYDSPFFVVRYAHEERYRRAIDVVKERRPCSLLDYGAGDGHFLSNLCADGDYVPERYVAYEPIEHMAVQIHASMGESRPKSFEVVTERRRLDSETFDLILCLGVLEHMPLSERDSFYELCRKRLSPEGCCLIDVPVEIGPTLLIKHAGRVLLKGRESEYSAEELLNASFGRRVFDPTRFDARNESGWIGSHKGFDYRLFRQELQHHLDIVDMFSTPFGRLPPWCGNQEVYFVAKPKDPDAPD